MKRRSKPAISRVRLDGRSKDERYRADNSRAFSSQLPRENLSSPPSRPSRPRREEKVWPLIRAREFNAKRGRAAE